MQALITNEVTLAHHDITGGRRSKAKAVPRASPQHTRRPRSSSGEPVRYRCCHGTSRSHRTHPVTCSGAEAAAARTAVQPASVMAAADWMSPRHSHRQRGSGRTAGTAVPGRRKGVGLRVDEGGFASSAYSSALASSRSNAKTVHTRFTVTNRGGGLPLSRFVIHEGAAQGFDSTPTPMSATGGSGGGSGDEWRSLASRGSTHLSGLLSPTAGADPFVGVRSSLSPPRLVSDLRPGAPFFSRR